MDRRIESFLTDVLALEGEDQHAVREAVRGALKDREEILGAQETNNGWRRKRLMLAIRYAAPVWSMT